MALEVQVKLNHTGEEAFAFQRWQSRDYTQSSKHLLGLTAWAKTEVKHHFTNIAFAFIVKAATDTEVVSMFKDNEAEPAVVFNDMLILMGLDIAKMELQASGATTLDVYVAGT